MIRLQPYISVSYYKPREPPRGGESDYERRGENEEALSRRRRLFGARRGRGGRCVRKALRTAIARQQVQTIEFGNLVRVPKKEVKRLKEVFGE